MPQRPGRQPYSPQARTHELEDFYRKLRLQRFFTFYQTVAHKALEYKVGPNALS